jgi:hypothetical protein
MNYIYFRIWSVTFFCEYGNEPWIWDVHSGEPQMWCNAVYSGRSLATFRRNILPSCSACCFVLIGCCLGLLSELKDGGTTYLHSERIFGVVTWSHGQKNCRGELGRRDLQTFFISPFLHLIKWKLISGWSFARIMTITFAVIETCLAGMQTQVDCVTLCLLPTSSRLTLPLWRWKLCVPPQYVYELPQNIRDGFCHSVWECPVIVTYRESRSISGCGG